MKKSLLLFDNDGVLVDTEQWFFQANREILESIGIPLTEDIYQEIMVKGKSALNLAKVKNYSDEEIEKLRLQRDKIYHHYLKIKDLKIPGVLETLERLKPHFKMAIVTTSMPDSFALIHQRDDITKFMDKIFTRNHYKYSKPHPDPKLTALQAFSILPENALVIEDSERGLRSAIAANIDCCVVKNHFTINHDFTKATYKINHLAKLPDILFK